MKTIIITGATSGFGIEMARLLAKDNKLILLARRESILAKLKSELDDNGGIYTATVDVRDKNQVDEFYKNLPEKFKNIDVLINNAGLAKGMNPAQDTNLEDWDVMVDTNIKGLLYITRGALETMKLRGTGHIINIGSVAAKVPYKGGNVYGATKAFVAQFSRNLRTDLFATGIKVTNLEPGAAETEFASVRFEDDAKAKEFYSGWQPLRAIDVAKTIEWILNQPPHVSIENIEIMPMDQTYGGLLTNKKSM